MNTGRSTVAALMAAAACAGSVSAAEMAKVDWKRVPASTLTLFYPGQSTYQWLRSTAHPGARMVRNGGACTTCHKGKEERLGDALVKGGSLEPTPVKGKQGTLKLRVQVAYDDANAYFRLRWPTGNRHPGDAYPFYRFDGGEWKAYGGPRLAPRIQKGEEPAIYEDRASIMIDDGSVPDFGNQGCWITCHAGERDNPNQPTADEVRANALYAAIKRSDVRKYLPATRSDAAASWDKGRSLGEIEREKAAGRFLDLVQWRAHRSNPVGMADDGYVLEWRHFDAGRNPFSSNMDPKAKQPRFMYDAKKLGKSALRDTDIRSMPTFLVEERNAAPFDPNAGWKAGDLLPQYVLSRSASTGSAADNKRAQGVWHDGTWTVVLARPLNLRNADDKTLAEGGIYNFAFAVHDDNITTRGHHVSFPVKVGFGRKATIQATKLK